MKGIKKKAGGIFDFLMQFGKVFVGFKLLEWLSDPANLVKVETVVGFFGSVFDFVGKTIKAIGKGFNWTVEKLKEGIQFVKDTVTKIGEFYSFDWFDGEAIQEQLEGITKIFTEGIPELFKEINLFFTEDLPNMFSEIGTKLSLIHI